MYVPTFASTTTNLTQSAPTGGGSTTTLTVSELAKILTSSTHTLTATVNASFTATWTLLYDGQSIGSITINSGSSTGSTTLAQEVRLDSGKQLAVQAPAGFPLSGGSLTMTWRVNASEWALVPQEPDRVFCNNGGVWTSAKEVWVAQETIQVGVYEWVRAWRVPEPPAGVKPDLEQWDDGQSVIVGGDVRASWINTTTEFSVLVSFEVDDGGGYIVADNVSRPPGSTDAILDRSFVNNGDQVRARMRYFEGGVQGDFSAYSDVLSYVDF